MELEIKMQRGHSVCFLTLKADGCLTCVNAIEHGEYICMIDSSDANQSLYLFKYIPLSIASAVVYAVWAIVHIHRCVCKGWFNTVCVSSLLFTLAL